jgi:hypothetical protein
LEIFTRRDIFHQLQESAIFAAELLREIVTKCEGRQKFIVGTTADQKEPILVRENGPPSHPPHQHNQADNHGNQHERVGGLPNQDVCDH